MVDIVEKSVRSRMMAANKAKNTKPELLLRRFLHGKGFRYRIHVRSLPGSPDLVLPKYKLAIFVHGCFWHQHVGCRFATTPDERREQWQSKFIGTQARDERDVAALRQSGWRVFLIWECGLTKGGAGQSLEWLPEAIRQPAPDFISWPQPTVDPTKRSA